MKHTDARLFVCFAVAAFVASPSLASSSSNPQTLREQEIRSDIERALAQRLRDAASGARIVAVDGLSDQALPAGRIAIEIGAIAGRWPRARAGVPVRVRVDGRVVRTLTAWVRTTDPRRVWTYADAAPAKSRAEALRLTPSDVDMVCCEGPAAADADALRGLRLRRAARVGAPVLNSDFEPIPDAVAREAVAIEVVRGPVRITTVGTALADGRIGQTIAVRPEGSDRPVAARVTAKRKVRIDERVP